MRSLFTFVISMVCALYAMPQESIYSFEPEKSSADSVFPQSFEQSPALYPANQLSGEGKWSKDFAVPGIIGNIYVTATDGTNLYVGGNFAAAGGTMANSVAMWDGNKWHSIGEGTENGVGGDIPSVEAMAFIDGKLFVGGQFSKAGSEEVNGIAFWDGTKWNKLGNGNVNGVIRKVVVQNDTLILRGFIYALMAYNNKIIVGGDFQFAGDSVTDGIAAWNISGSHWETMDHGLGRLNEHSRVTVFSLAAFEDNIYAGGTFQFLADGELTRNIARWNGTSWKSMGEAAGYIHEMKTDQAGILYAAGYYHPDEEITGGACGIGKWNGTSWSSMNGPAGYQSSVSHMLFHNNEMYVSGNFSKYFESPDQSFAKWDGTNWQIIEGLGQTYLPNTKAGITSMEWAGGKLYVAGYFTRAGVKYAVNIAEWDDENLTWDLLDDGNANQGIHDGRIMALEQKGDTLYAGGTFSVAGGVLARSIAKWTGKAWVSLGPESNYYNGIRGMVYAILADSNNVYAGGYFDLAGGEAAFHIARWDGSRWWPVGIGVGGIPGAHVRALAKSGDYLYVAGYFAVVGDAENYEIPANSIARFNLKTERWETLGRGIEYVYGIPGKVNDLEVHGDTIYVGGEFYSADEAFYENFAVLAGDKWSGLETNDIGIKGSVRKIKVFQNEIYIGGILKYNDEGSSYGILKWNGAVWESPGDSLTAGDQDVFVNDMVVFDSGLVAGGLFTMAGDELVNNMARFDGQTWSAIGGGVLPGISRLAATENNLYTAGPVQIYSGNGLSIGLSRLTFTPGVILDLPDSYMEHDWISVYPNPFRTTTTIAFSIAEPGIVKVVIYDEHGREIRSLMNSNQPAGHYTLPFDSGDFPAGIYFCKLMKGKHVETSKMIMLGK